MGIARIAAANCSVSRRVSADEVSDAPCVGVRDRPSAVTLTRAIRSWNSASASAATCARAATRRGTLDAPVGAAPGRSRRAPSRRVQRGELGGKSGPHRGAEQIEIERFWDDSLPAIDHGVLRSMALQPGRDVTRSARLLSLQCGFLLHCFGGAGPHSQDRVAGNACTQSVSQIADRSAETTEAGWASERFAQH